MKRIGFIYEQIVSVENCKEAIINASRHKRSRTNVKRILADIDYYAQDLSDRFQRLDFTTPYRPKVIVDGLSGKKREIMIPSFYPDQCAHHAIMQILRPIFMRSSYYWSCGNMPRRGISRAAKGVSRATTRDAEHAKYCFKYDIKKFYPSIPHDKLKEKLRRKFKDKKALDILFIVIDSHKQGLPIGNYTSPWFAEFYLQSLDRFVTEQDGVRHYVRYVDDGVIVGSNKRKLHKAAKEIMQYLCLLGLKIKENYQLFKVYKNGIGRKIDFVGRCFAVGFATIRKRRALAYMRQSRRIQKAQARKQEISFKEASGFISRSSCMLYTNSFGLRKKYYETVNINDLKNIIRRASQCMMLADIRETQTQKC